MVEKNHICMYNQGVFLYILAKPTSVAEKFILENMFLHFLVSLNFKQISIVKNLPCLH